MQNYYYKAPYLKSSTKKCTITNSQGQAVGSIQRYFKSPIHRFIDTTIGGGNLIVRLKANRLDKTKIIEAYTETAMIKRPNYYIKYTPETGQERHFQAIQTNNININPEFTIKDKQLEITAKSHQMGTMTFYEGRTEIANWQVKISQKNQAQIQIHQEATIQNPLLYAILAHLLYFIGY